MDVDSDEKGDQRYVDNILYYQYLPKQIGEDDLGEDEEFHTGIKLEPVTVSVMVNDGSPVTPYSEASDDERALPQNGELFVCISSLWIEILISHLSINCFKTLPRILYHLIKEFVICDSKNAKQSIKMDNQYKIIPPVLKFGRHADYRYPYDMMHLNFDLPWNPIEDWVVNEVDHLHRNRILKEMWAKLSSFAKYMVDCRRDFEIETKNIDKHKQTVGILGIYTCIKPSIYFNVDLLFCEDLLNECDDRLNQGSFLTPDGMLINPQAHDRTWVTLPLIRYMLKMYCAFGYYRLAHLQKYGSVYIQRERYKFITYFPDTYCLNWQKYQFNQVYPQLRKKCDGAGDSELIQGMLVETKLRL